MKTRIALLFLISVVLPTAVLSLMAGYTFKNWEVVVEKKLEVTAGAALQAVIARMDEILRDELRQVMAALGQRVAEGAGPAELEAAAARFRDARRLTRQIFVFMNPWGFVYPLGGEEGQDAERPLDILLAVLRRQIAGARAREAEVRFMANNAAYCFAPLPGLREMYAGCEINTAVFLDRLKGLLAEHSHGGISFVAEGPGLDVSDEYASAASHVVIDAPFVLRRDGKTVPSRGWNRDLVESRLPPPFDHIRIRARMNRLEEFRRVSDLQARLYAWGIVLLASGILFGGGLVLREASREVGRARARALLVMGLSHDLRTPIASLRMLAESLHLDYVTDPEKRRQFLAAMVKESERLQWLVERVLFLVRLEQGSLVYNLAPVAVGTVIHQAVEDFRDRLWGCGYEENGGVHVEIRGAAASMEVKGDRAALTQLVLNLLDNAAKYGVKGGARTETSTDSSEAAPARTDRAAIEVTLEAVTRRHGLLARKQTWICVSVADHGPGIPPGEQRRIFKEFYRGSGAAERNVSGVGLGLALCRHVARAHGGWIDVESELGQGSIFRVWLPALASAGITSYVEDVEPRVECRGVLDK